MKDASALFALIPGPPNWEIPWARIEEALPRDWLARMQATPQDSTWHGEGDVWAHSRLVCKTLAADDAFRALPEAARTPVFLAALLHDVGKIQTTRREDGRWVSPGHSKAGAYMVRVWLWQSWGLCGTSQTQQLRECICTLIRWHATPLHLADNPAPERWLRRLAAQGEQISSFSLRLLAILVKADVLGRICPDQKALCLAWRFFADYAMELDCYTKPPAFASPATRFACLQGKPVWPDQPLYDNSWGQIIMLSGLPGTGKDTWIRCNCRELPAISLDEIRAQRGLSPVGSQAEVVHLAQEQATAYLRQKQPFVWNATSISQELRSRQLALFHRYGASVRLVYLETDWQTQQERNRNRQETVPEGVLCRYLEKLEPPEIWEAQQVEWITV